MAFDIIFGRFYKCNHLYNSSHGSMQDQSPQDLSSIAKRIVADFGDTPGISFRGGVLSVLSYVNQDILIYYIILQLAY